MGTITATRNYAEFYALIKKLPGATDGLKEDLVMQFTKGRTTSLREMSDKEYKAMCASLRETQNEGMSAEMHKKELKKRRSAVLKRLTKLGVDTSEWANVDNYCLSPRIAGKKFAKLSIEELAALIPKLENMLRKRNKKQPTTPIELVNLATVCWN